MEVILPSGKEMQRCLARLKDTPGGIVLVAIEQPFSQSFPRVTWGYFTPEERKALKAALIRCRTKRERNEQ